MIDALLWNTGLTAWVLIRALQQLEFGDVRQNIT